MAKAINEAIEMYIVEHHPDMEKLDLLIDQAEREIDLINSKIRLLEKQKSELQFKIERYRYRKQFIVHSRAAIGDIINDIVQHFISYCDNTYSQNLSFWNGTLGGSYTSAVDIYLNIFSKKISRAKDKARARGAILIDADIKSALLSVAHEKDNMISAKTKEYITV